MPVEYIMSKINYLQQMQQQVRIRLGFSQKKLNCDSEVNNTVGPKRLEGPMGVCPYAEHNNVNVYKLLRPPLNIELCS